MLFLPNKIGYFCVIGYFLTRIKYSYTCIFTCVFDDASPHAILYQRRDQLLLTVIFIQYILLGGAQSQAQNKSAECDLAQVYCKT